MPKIFGTSLLGILLATVAFFMVGALFYGALFGEQWMASNNLTEATTTAIMENQGLMFWVWALLIPLLQVLGIAYVINHAGASKLLTCIKIGATIAVLFALPVLAYDHLYAGKALMALKIDFGHVLVGYIVASAVLSFFRGKDAIGN
ncbi:MAG: hypothetical protein COB36_14135 [Alphaproteobacteria bacterium]|nr:MAG: hypothetical protein COB36_14135 [Alphaproteobacteria bacterium]